MGARRASAPAPPAKSEAEIAAEQQAAREKLQEEDRLRREEEARRSGLRGTQVLLGGGGFVGFDRGSLGSAAPSGGDRGPLSGGSAARSATATEAEFRRIMRSGNLGTIFTGVKDLTR